MAKHTRNRLSHPELVGKSERGYYADGGGLYFRVSEFNSKLWAFRYTRNGKLRELGLGSFDDVSLKEARERASEARKLLRNDIDPIDQRQSAKSAMLAAREAALTFEQCASAYIASKAKEWKNAKHASQWINTLTTYAYPIIGKILVSDVGQPHILKILEPIWEEKTETASRLRGRLENVLDYASARHYRTGENPARWKGHLDKILATPSKIAKIEHHAALPYSEIGKFMADLSTQVGIGSKALKFLILTAARSGEIRGARWNELDLTNNVWIIPETRMKAGKEHRIPLSKSAVEILNSISHSDDDELIFSNNKGAELSDMTLSAVLKRMDLKITVHGFRSTFRDWAGETTAYPRDVIENALAHQLKDKAEAAYARGSQLEKRSRLMNDWDKFCNAGAITSSVTPINIGRGAI